MAPQLISIILPAYKQADHIEQVVKEVVTELQQLPVPFELILVPNGPEERTFQKCDELSRCLPHTRSIPISGSGWGRAVNAGLQEARGELLCYSNSARTNAQELRRVIDIALSLGPSLVKATRRSRDSLFRRAGSVLFNFECRMLFDLSCWDINGTPKVFPRLALSKLDTGDTGDLFDLRLLVSATDCGLQVVEVPISCVQRHGGTSTTSFRRGLGLYVGAIKWYRCWKRARPASPSPQP